MPLSQVMPTQHDPLGLSQGRFKDVRHFMNLINPVIERLNVSIGRYNRERNPAKKLRQLRIIYAEFKRISDRAPGKIIKFCPNFYEELHKKLYQGIQQEFMDFNVFSMEEDAAPDSITDKLANMSPDNVEQFVKALVKKGSTDVSVFLGGNQADYISRFLGGGNSKNLGVKVRGEPGEYVLKVEERLGMSRHVETYLRQRGLSGIFTPMLASRQVTYLLNHPLPDGTRRVTQHLVLTKVCDGGDLVKASKKHGNDDEKRIDAALDIYTQMSEVLGVVEANGCVFTDMKNSNWLLDEAGNLKISDTKGFLFTNERGELDRDDFDEQNGNYGSILYTQYMEPQELGTYRPKADKLHAHMLGKNLYQYLMQFSDNDFYVRPNDRNSPLIADAALSFNAPVFRGPRGEKLKTLIQALMHPSPENRPSVEEAREQLQAIGQPPNRETKTVFEHVKACKILISQIKQFKKMPLHRTDVLMNTFAELMVLKMGSAETPDAKALIQSRLTLTLDALNTLRQAEPRDEVFFNQRDILFEFALEDTPDVEAILQAFPAHLQTCTSLMREIIALKVTVRGVRDSKVEAFIDSIGVKMQTNKTLDEMSALKVELSSMLDNLNESHAMVQEIEGLAKQTGADKGKRIAEALSQVPLSDRGAIAKGSTPETEAVLKAMASHQSLWRRLTAEGKEGSLDSKKSATMFKDFKKRHQAEMDEKAPKNDDLDNAPRQ